MSYPAEYENAVNNLKDFRRTLEDKYIRGRLTKLLEANSRTLEMYRELLEQVSITPQLFGNLNRYEMVLRGKSLYVPSGKIAQVKSKYTGIVTPYPDVGEPKVSPRNLPSVDRFIKKFPSSVETMEKVGIEIWSNYFVMQTDHEQFSNTPDAKNAFYDYYKFKPIKRALVSISPSNPTVTEFSDIEKVKGEATVMIVSLRDAENNAEYIYKIYAILDADLFTSTEKKWTVPVAVCFEPFPDDYPELTIVALGKRISTKDAGLFVGWVEQGQLIGWTKTHDIVSITEEKVYYAIPVKVVTRAEPEDSGCHVLPVCTEEQPCYYKAGDEKTFAAYESIEWMLDRWRINGIERPATDGSITLTLLEDTEVVGIFVHGAEETIRPTADHYISGIVTYPSGVDAYTTVDEEQADGQQTFFETDYYGEGKALFELSNPTWGAGSNVKFVEVTAVCQSAIEGASVELVVKTHGMEYSSPRIDVGTEWQTCTYRWDKNPVTREPWTQEDVNNLIAGIKLHAVSIFALRCTQLYVKVREYS